MNSNTAITHDDIDTSDFSSTILPSDDFFEYVNQKWINAHPIPADKAAIGMFDILDEDSRNVVKKILENAANLKIKAPEGSNLQKLGDFYRSAMDTVMIENAGVQPLQSWLNEIDAAKTPKEIIRVMARLQLRNINTPIGYYVDVDAKNTTRYIMNVGQGGLGLPDKDFYFRTDEKSKKLVEAYKKYIQTIVHLAHLDTQTSDSSLAQQIFDVELALADASFSRVELRDPEKNYNLFTFEKLQSTYKNIDWSVFFGEMKVAPKEIVVGQPSFFQKYDSLLLAIPHEKWAIYQKYQLVSSLANSLNNDILDAKFDFFGRTMSGVETMEPRWKRITRSAEHNLRDLIGQEYVKVKFSANAKQRALELVNNIKASLKERILNLSWMGDSTKTKAVEKLGKIDVKIGYPNKWYTYENYDIKYQPYVLNILNCSYGDNLRVLAKLDNDTIDRTEWGMGPQTVNAYYNPLKNEIVFPAAILQPPFFYENGDDAVNYGGIGMVIGHEITHGFDDQGSQFDADGNLKNWWTADDRKQYEAMTKKFVDEYNSFKPFAGDSLHVNGELTLGENIADLGGMVISFNALQKALENKKMEKISGLTPEQRFFINFAIIWRTNFRPEALRMQILSNEHSPAKYRVNGVLKNLPIFYHAFDVKAGDNMFTNEAERAVMW
ncbi:MAG: M13 family metallopeptidase [Bacteroidetes bacterium]|nr:M13 family metallopeptidase [Bacteroidota bacterium]